jgi:hypothetical protein
VFNTIACSVGAGFRGNLGVAVGLDVCVGLAVGLSDGVGSIVVVGVGVGPGVAVAGSTLLSRLALASAMERSDGADGDKCI